MHEIHDIEALMAEEIEYAGEYNGNYYVILKKECYDGAVFVVDKKTKNVSVMRFVDLVIMEQPNGAPVSEAMTPIDPKLLV